MMNTIDLQIQSTASDGKHTPREIAAIARDLKLSAIALTDHDTVEGVHEILSTEKEYGIRVISGIEISIEEYGLHLLGYGIDYKNEELRASLARAAEDRIGGAKQMVENLKNAGFKIEWADVMREATGAVVARPHIARAILARPENKEKLAGIATVHDFIEAHLSNESPHYVRRARIGARHAIALMHRAGGVAVWSHPAIHFRDNADKLETFLRQLKEWDIDGIEVFNPSHTEDDVELLQGLASKYRLLRTAGSDFHEKGEHAADPVSGLHSARTLADFETYGFAIDDIMPRLDEAMAQRRKDLETAPTPPAN